MVKKLDLRTLALKTYDMERNRLGVLLGFQDGLISMEHSFYSLDAEGAAKELGCSIAVLIDKLASFDYSAIPSLTEREEGDTEKWVRIRSMYPFTVIVLFDRRNNGIAGYMSFVPLDRETFMQIKAGKLIDGDIRAESIPQLKPGSRPYIYFTMIFLKEEYRHTGTVNELYRSFTKMLSEFAAKGIFFHEVALNAYTSEGERSAIHLGMKFVANGTPRGRIYSASTLQLLSSNSLMADRALAKAYSKIG